MTQDQKDYITANSATIDINTMAVHLKIRYFAVWEYCNRHGLPTVKSPRSNRTRTKTAPQRIAEGCFNVNKFSNWVL
jgi:hypothetical protein